MEKIGSLGRKAIWLTAMVVCLGHLMIWIMVPTMDYRMKWQPKLKAKFNSSTYFGNQGTNLLLYTFPVLFVAVCGSIYLHLGKKVCQNGHHETEGSGDKKSRLEMLRQPMLVRGPLGIVSSVELAFLIMFTALLVWSMATYLHVSFSMISPSMIEKNGGKRWKAKFDYVGLRLGMVGNICLAFLFYPVTRASTVLPLFGLTSEGSIKYHIWLGHLTMVLFTAHGVCYFILWGLNHSLSEILKWQHGAVANIPGEISLLAGLFLWATTFPRIRRNFFELFFYTHYLYILFVFFFILHVGISYAYIMIPGFYLFMIDRYLRFLQSRRCACLVSARVLHCGLVELNFSKSPALAYTPTSIMFVNVPSISKLQWHPFTITSSSQLEQDNLSVLVKVEGRWTRKLHEKLASNSSSSSSSSVHRLQVSVEGPYGPASTHFLRHDMLVMVAGGSGIAPFISIIRELIYVKKTLKSKTPKLLLICAFRKRSELAMLDLILPLTGVPADVSDLELNIEAYVTRENEKQLTNENIKQVQTVWLRPDPSSDAPIYPVLGQNGWLWLAATISSSFIAYLLFMGILTRFYIYPKHSFSYSTRATLNVLLMCVCIAGSTSMAVLWDKIRNAKETMQITSTDRTPGQRSPESQTSDAERELESLPRQSLAQSTNVQYGERPDLKTLLCNCKGSSIGVLVCGPRSMRHEVAAICSSDLSSNLHFEAISFSW